MRMHMCLDAHGRLSYKAFYRTAGATPCLFPNGTHAPSGMELLHDPPLIFDLSEDPSEHTPLANPPSELIESFARVRSDVMASIAGGFVSNTSYATGGREAWPCCNPDHPACCCESE